MEVIVKTTDACNAVCAYCSASCRPGRTRRLDLDLARLLCDQVAGLLDTGRFARARLLWHGGEPLLLGKDFYREAARWKSARRIEHRMQTNLTLLDREWIEVLEPLLGGNGIGTSLDPLDDVRALPGGSYNDRWLESLDLLDEFGWRVGCVYVLHRRGMPHARDVYWFFRNLRDNATLSLRVNPLLAVGRARHREVQSLVLRPGEYGEFLVAMGEVWLADRGRLALSPLREMAWAMRGQSVAMLCDHAGRAGCVESHLGVDPDGTIYNCGRGVDAGGSHFGNLRQTDLETCLRHPARDRLAGRDDALRKGRCGRCSYWPLCHGGCPYEAHAESERTLAPTQLCTDYLRIFRWLESRADLLEMPLADTVAVAADPVEAAVGPDGPDGGLQAVLALTRRGVSVRLDRPRDWPAAEWRAAAEFFLHASDLEVAVEPFWSALLRLSHRSAQFSLRRLYGDDGPVPPRRQRPAPCGFCEAWKGCRGFWLDPVASPQHCRVWREIVAALADAACGGGR